MKIFLASLAMFLVVPTVLPALEVLANGSFETEIQTGEGNHHGGTPTGWTVGANPAAKVNFRLANLVRGVVADGAGATDSSEVLPVGNTDNAPGGPSFSAGKGQDVAAYHRFTLSGLHAGPTVARADSGDGSTPQLFAGPSAVNLAASAWVQILYTGTPAAGTRASAVLLANTDPADAASLNVAHLMPEPAAGVAFAGLVMTGGMFAGLLRHQRR